MAPTPLSVVLALARAALVVFAIGALPAQAEFVSGITAHGLHACAATQPTGVKCWGWNIDGQLGDGTRTDRSTPVAVAGLTGPVGALASGARHTCAIVADGIKCWGDNAWGQLGDGTNEDRLTPVAVVGIGGDVVAIAAGDSHTCALMLGGTLKCWGNNSEGQVGDGTLVDRNVPVAITAAGSGLLAISMGWYHTCVITNPQGLKCWGSNGYGQLATTEPGVRPTPGDVPPFTSGVHALSLGANYTCIVTTSGAAKCWGQGDAGQLGDGSFADRSTPKSVAGLGTGVTGIAAGYAQTCALVVGGTVKCWGDNTSGQLGDGSNVVSPYPVAVSGLVNVTALAAAPFHMCAYQPGAPIACWGGNNMGQVGDGTNVNRNTPTPVSGGLVALPPVRRIVFTPLTLVFGPQAVGTTSAGQVLTLTNIGSNQSSVMQPIGIGGNEFQMASSTCGLFLPANASCTIVVSFTPTAAGLRSGNLGTAASESDTAVFAGTGFVPASPGSGVAAIVGGSAHTCARTSAGAMKCWGFGAEGQLGDGASTQRLLPVDVLGLGSGVAAISSLGGSTCALTTGGGAKCWGSNVEGQLGDGSITNRASPTDVATLASGVASLAASYLHGCAVTTTGGVQCWGHNGFGQLGNPSPARQTTPTAVTLLGASIAIVSTGPFHACAITTVIGRVKCWGNNAQGQLGNGVAEVGGTWVPQDVEGLQHVVALATGHSHTCALDLAGAVRCWGDNIFGQLGDGTNVDRLQPVGVVGLQSGVVAISATSYHTCALMSAGSVKCWGSNDQGQLGNGTTVDSPVPVDAGMAAAVAIGTGQYHSCAATPNGAQCWGQNTHGQLGDGTTARRLVPTAVAFPVPDTTPNAFAFASRTGVALFSLQTSDSVTPAGYDTPAPISVANGLYSIGCVAYTNAPGTISPGQSVCLQHNAAATSGASMTTTLTIGGVAGAFTTSTGAGPALSLTPATLDFGNQLVGTTSTSIIATLTNTGGSNATFLPPSITGDYTIAATTCGLSLAPAASCTITVTFTPAALGARAGTLTVANFINPAASALTGTGVTASPAALSFSPVSLAFGSQPVGTTSAALVTTLSNTGGSTAELNPVSPPQATAEYQVTSTTCGTSLPANASCTLTIAFTPAATGLRLGTFVVFTELGAKAGALTGTGVPGAFPGTVAMIASGNSHTCALTAAGGVKCWGSNLHGQLGDGTTNNSATPVDVVGLSSGIAAITAGSAHTCALTTAGGVKCWGSNFRGLVGDGSNVDRTAPADVVGLASGVAAIDAGGTHSCALTNAGGVKCWGYNAYGQLGDGTETERNVPGDVLGLTSGMAVIAGGGDHTCAITSQGALKCWGSNGSGQLGLGSFTVLQSTPLDVPGMQFGTTGVTAGLHHTCALNGLGGLKCWGDNTQGNLGEGTDIFAQPLPTDVVGLSSGVASVSAGGQLTCAVTNAGGVKCWGSNGSGALGDGSTTNRNTPVDVIGIASGALAVAPGAGHTCALLAGGSVKCWGFNSVGQLGDGTLVDRPVPGPVAGLAGADTTPNAFTFPSRTGVGAFTQQVSDPVTPVGYAAPAPVSIANGTYSIGCGLSGTYTSAAGTINPGQSVCVQHNAAATGGTSVTTTLTIGGVAGTFTTTTAGAAALSLTPASLDFGSQPVGATSAGITATLTNTGGSNASFFPPSVTGDFAIASTSCGTSLAAGASCAINVTFTPTAGGARTGTLTVANFINPAASALTGTGTADTTPDAFSFAPKTGVIRAVTEFSDVITPVGYAAPAAISVTDGEYSIGCAGPFTAAAGTLNPGQSVCVRHTTAPTFLTTVSTTLTIGGVSAEFKSTTMEGITLTPASLDFGTVPVGSTGAQQVVTLTYTGVGSTTVGPVTEADFPVIAQTCNGFISAASSCTITLAFRPTSVAARSSAMLVFTSTISYQVSLSGTGGKSLQSIVFGRLLDRGLGIAPFPVKATASSNLPVSFTSLTPAACTVAGSLVSLVAVGTCTLAADQAGGPAHEAAPRVTQSFNVSALPNPLDIIAIDAGEGDSCAVTGAGTLECWGNNDNGKLGTGDTIGTLTPVDASALQSSVVSVALGHFHSCALTTGGGVKCWGANYDGRLGDLTAIDRLQPVDVVGLASGVVSIAANDSHTCALTSSGGVKCWGYNGDGQLGGSQLTDVPGAGYVTGLASGVAGISAGTAQSCAVTTAGAVMCWGNGIPVPTIVPGLSSGVVAVAAGRAHACALTSGGGVKCWGRNAFGELGDGTGTNSATPVDVVGLGSGVAAIAAGSEQSCAVLATGVVKCWGSGSYGQFGGGSQAGSLSPVNVVGLADNAVAIASGGSHNCALTTVGGVRCWGHNYAGQLGNNTTLVGLVATGVVGLDGDDMRPDAFAFAPQPDAAPGSVRTSNTIIPAGYQEAAPISVANGTYSIGCSATFTAAAGTILPGQSVCVRHAASLTRGGAVTTTLTLGGISAPFTSTAAVAHPTVSPAVLAFPDQPVGTTGPLDVVVVTNDGPDTLYGLGWGVAANFNVSTTTCTATLAPNASCALLVTMTPVSIGNHAEELLVFSTSGDPAVLRVLLSGKGTFNDTTPNTFSFVDQFLVPVNTVITSAPVLISNITSFAIASVIGGTYAISSGNNCSGDVLAFTTRPAPVEPGRYICVRHTSSAVPGGSNDTQLIVGGMGDTFTTVTRDPVPAAFVLGSQLNVAPGTMRTSAAVAITGINAPADFSVAGGEISVNCTGAFASTGSLAPGSSICARHVTGSGFGTTTTTTVNVGGVESTFVTRTFDVDGDADNDGIPNGVEYNEAKNPEAKDNDIFGSPRLFAMQQYRDFLGREGDAGGIAFYMDLINTGAANREEIIASFLASPEFATGLPSVIRLYLSFFDRTPDYGGLTFQLNAFRQGTPLELIAQNFYNSPEFTDRYGALTNDAYINLVYQNVLGRTADPGGFAYYKNLLDSGTITKGQMMIGFSESPEFQALTSNEVYVVSVYAGLLRRAPEAGGLDFYADLLDQGLPRRAILPGFFHSPEYRNRFLP